MMMMMMMMMMIIQCLFRKIEGESLERPSCGTGREVGLEQSLAQLNLVINKLEVQAGDIIKVSRLSTLRQLQNIENTEQGLLKEVINLWSKFDEFVTIFRGSFLNISRKFSIIFPCCCLPLDITLYRYFSLGNTIHALSDPERACRGRKSQIRLLGHQTEDRISVVTSGRGE